MSKPDQVQVLNSIMATHSLSQSGLARLAGFSEATISRWMTRKTNASMRDLARVVQAVGGVPSDYSIALTPDVPDWVVELTAQQAEIAIRLTSIDASLTAIRKQLGVEVPPPAAEAGMPDRVDVC
jgi:transcriptional regulator with XRE-family HTH domain